MFTTLFYKNVKTSRKIYEAGSIFFLKDFFRVFLNFMF